MSAYDSRGRRKYLNRAEGRRFLDQACEIPRTKALFCLVLYYTGCRISEALDLRSHEIDLEMNVVLIRSLKKRGKKVIRRIPIPEFLTQGLSEMASPAGASIWPFSRTTGWRIVKSVMAPVQISGVHAMPKGLRHGFGVRGVLGKLPVTLIQKLMGHADLSTTAIYLDVQDEEERKLIENTWV